MPECNREHSTDRSSIFHSIYSANPSEGREFGDVRWHFECPECKYNSGQTSSLESAKAMAEMHRHPVNLVSSIMYVDGHTHRKVISPNGGIRQEIRLPDQERPSEMPLRQLLATHVFTPAFGKMGLDNMPLGGRTFGSIQQKKLGLPQASSMLERHYQMVMRQTGAQFSYIQDHVNKLISGETQPTVSVKYNLGTPVLVHGMTDLAVARKHLPDTPIKIQYVD